MIEKPRFFFGLRIPKNYHRQIITWRAAQFTLESGYQVAADALYFPLAYLGTLSDTKCQVLQRLAGQVRQPPFTLALDDAGYWPRAASIWLGSRSPPRALLQLAAVLRAQAARNGCHQPPYPFHPQVVILRHVAPETVLPSCDFSWPLYFTHFTLMQSYYRQGRYHQQDVAQWSLYQE
ncbi:MAG: RNA 2',3'-cyclic phosphodiesterase [Candidatus Erwinia impunctatus]|nr:RNA 2',3'-cyclic phosphodiesterase [Culicoides impunctatus]